MSQMGIREAYKAFNAFYPEYFDSTSLDCPVSFDYDSFLVNFFTTMKNFNTTLGDRLSFEIGNEENLLGSYWWGSPSEFREYAVKVYTKAKQAGFQDVVIGGLSNIFAYKQSGTGNPVQKSISGLYNNYTLPGIVSDLNNPVFSWHHYPEGFVYQPYSLSKIDEFNEEFKSTNNNFDFLKGSVITEFNLNGPPNTIDINSPKIVHEFGKLLDFAARHNITQIYLNKLVELPGQASSCDQSTGFFNCNGDPKKSYYYFKKVLDIVKNGYTVERFVNDNVSPNQEYLDITSKLSVCNDEIPYAKTRDCYYSVLRVAIENAPISTNNDTIFTTCSNTQTYLCPGSWQIYKKKDTGERFHPQPPKPEVRIIYTPNPVACEHVKAEWGGELDLSGFNRVRFELMEVQSGNVVFSSEVLDGSHVIIINSCTLKRGPHRGRLIGDEQILAEGELMVMY